MFTFAIQICNFIYRGRFGLNFNLDQTKNTVTDRAFGVLNLFIYNSNKFTYKFDIQSIIKYVVMKKRSLLLFAAAAILSVRVLKPTKPTM